MDPANANVPEPPQGLTFPTPHPSGVNPNGEELPPGSPPFPRQDAHIISDDPATSG
jgi:hypothetical protein